MLEVLTFVPTVLQMSSLWKHPKSKYWVACFTDRAGRRLKRSTKETDRKKAQKIAEAYEEGARRVRTAKQVRAVLTSLHEQLAGEALPTMSVRQFFTQWLATKAPEVSPSTARFYKQAVKSFLTFLGEAADKGIEFLTAQQVTRYRNEEARALAGKTVNHHIKALRMILKAAQRDGFTSENPAALVEPVRETGEGVRRRAFRIPELRAVLSVADDEWRSMVMFGLYSGQRLGDIASLTWSNIDLQANELRLKTRKTGRHSIIPLAAPLRAHIEKLPAGDDPGAALHPRAFDTLKTSGKAGGLSSAFADILAAAGLRETRREKRKLLKAAGPRRSRDRHALTFHSLRDTATTLLHEAGIPASVAQELIGHDSDEVHRGYVKVGRAALEKAAAAFPEI